MASAMTQIQKTTCHYCQRETPLGNVNHLGLPWDGCDPSADLTKPQLTYLVYGATREFQPVGRGWRTCDSLVKRGLMKHNGAPRHGGEKYSTSDAGLNVLRFRGLLLPSPAALTARSDSNG